MVHRDGNRIWVRVSFSRVEDPAHGPHLIVGTVREVTSEHYTLQRNIALAALAEQLAQADTMAAAVQAAVIVLEDDPVFNAGRGAALNEQGAIGLDASIMRGSDRAAGAVAAKPLTYALPDDTAQLKPGQGPGFEAAQNNCMACHSADYVATQPPKRGAGVKVPDVATLVAKLKTEAKVI